MGSQKNIKLLEEIRKWHTEELINVLELNGLGECCEAIRKKDIDGDSFLNLNETQLAFWRNLLTHVQIKRLWSCIQQARDRPANFIPQNMPSKQTNNDKANLLVSERLSNLREQENTSPPIFRRQEISENKPKLKPPPPIREGNINKKTGSLQEKKNSLPQTTTKPMMPLKPAILSNSKKNQDSSFRANESRVINNTVKTGKAKSIIAERLENLFGQQNNPSEAFKEQEVPAPPSGSKNIRNIPPPPQSNALGINNVKSMTSETVENLESSEQNFPSKEEELAQYENSIKPAPFLHSNSPLPPRLNAFSFNKAKSMSTTTMESSHNLVDKSASEDEVQYENNFEQVPSVDSLKSQSVIPPSPARNNMTNKGKFNSPISKKLENLFSQQNNPTVISQKQKDPEISEYFQEHENFSLSEDDEWDTSDNESVPNPPLNLNNNLQSNIPPTPPRPTNVFPPKPSIYTKRHPVPALPITKDISMRPPIPVPLNSSSFSKSSIPLPQVPLSNFPKPTLLPSSSGSFSKPVHISPTNVEENIYEEEPSKDEENVYEVEPTMEEENKFSQIKPFSPIYKVPPPNPKLVKREIPKPTLASRPLPLPPPDETLFPLPPNVIPIKRITKSPIPPDLPRPPFLPPVDIPSIPNIHDDEEVEYDVVDESEPDYKKQSWFQDIERKQAIRVLQCRPNGSFIVRPSKKSEIECAFSVIFDSKVYNLPVKKENGKLYFGKNTFHTVSEIVERFLIHPLVLNGPNNQDIFVNLRF